MNIEYPPLKRDATLAERGLDMARAAEIFEGATLTVEDDRRDYGETRQITIGFLDNRMVVMVWTQRGMARRIISLRKANERERKAYADRF
ncbi:MAG: BrnT family toxin [Rhodobacterales bacterium]|nr:BrnT family toxin [Rhodobacterales bacterium]